MILRELKELVLGLGSGDQAMAWPFSELRKASRAGQQVSATWQGQTVTVEYSEEHKTARLLDSSGNEIPTVIAFWFAWYAFHPETGVFEASSR